MSTISLNEFHILAFKTCFQIIQFPKFAALDEKKIVHDEVLKHKRILINGTNLTKETKIPLQVIDRCFYFITHIQMQN